MCSVVNLHFVFGCVCSQKCEFMGLCGYVFVCIYLWEYLWRVHVVCVCLYVCRGGVKRKEAVLTVNTKNVSYCFHK